MPHDWNINKITIDMDMEKGFPFPSDHHAIPRWKCMFCCCNKFLSVVIPDQESNRDDTNILKTIHFHVYRVLIWCKVHGRYPYDKKTCALCYKTPAIKTII